MANPLVSIVIPARNAAATIQRTLDSLSAQSYDDYEVIVVNDHSTDETCAVVTDNQRTDARIQLLDNTSRGVSSARNCGLNAATGDLVTFLDADDEVVPTWLMSMSKPFTEDPKIGLVCCGVRNVPATAKTITVPQELGGLYGSGRYLFLAGTFCLRRSVAVRAGGYDERISFGENFEFGIRVVRALINSDLHHQVVDEPLMVRNLAQDQRSERDASRLGAAEHMLEKYAADLQDDAEERSQLHRIAAVNAVRIGDQAAARSHARASLSARPFALGVWASAAIAHVPNLQKRWLRAARATYAPLAFLVGSPGSGATLLASLIGSDDDIVVSHESGFVLPSFEHGNRPTDVSGLLDIWKADPRLDTWGLSAEQWAQIPLSRTHGRPTDVLSEAYRCFAQQSGDKLIIDKTPEFVQVSRMLAQTFPSSHIVHLVRDGRDVAASWLNSDCGVSDIREAAYWWDLQNQSGLAIADSHPNYIQISYERLVEDPQQTALPLVERLGLDVDDWYQHSRDWPRTPALPDWRSELSISQISSFERIAGRTLDQLGYAPQARVPSLVGSASRAVVKATKAVRKVTRWQR